VILALIRNDSGNVDLKRFVEFIAECGEDKTINRKYLLISFST
jgi:hypothetical protein